jgi:hypothetical protein
LKTALEKSVVGVLRPIVVRGATHGDLVDHLTHELAASFFWLGARKVFEPVLGEPRLNFLPGVAVSHGAIAVQSVAEPNKEAVIPKARDLEINLGVIELLKDGAQGAASCREQLKAAKQNACKEQQKGYEHCLVAVSTYDRDGHVGVAH